MVSVMPYMFTSAGASSPNRSAHGRSSAVSSFSPANTTARSARPSGDGSAAVSARNADGVWLSTVTRSATSRSSSSSGKRVTSRGATTRVPPCSRAPHISNTDTSKAKEWVIDHTSPAVNARCSAAVDISRSTLAWVSTQPLGFPVEPEV
ncbi:hypothetical protein GCM10009634_78290 [Saccharothrix xinjiangensis]